MKQKLKQPLLGLGQTGKQVHQNLLCYSLLLPVWVPLVTSTLFLIFPLGSKPSSTYVVTAIAASSDASEPTTSGSATSPVSISGPIHVKTAEKKSLKRKSTSVTHVTINLAGKVILLPSMMVASKTVTCVIRVSTQNAAP